MDLKLLVIGLVVGLLVGVGVEYSMTGGQSSSLQSQITSLQTQANLVPDLQTRISSLTSDKTTLQNQVTTLQGQLTTKTSEATTLQTSLDSETSHVTSLQGQVSSLQGQVSNLQSQVKTLQAQLPVQQTGAWNVVKTYSGSGGTQMTTEYFTISQPELRVTWSYNEAGYLPYMFINLYPKGEMYLFTWSSGDLSVSSGTNLIHGITPGTYYLTIEPSSGVGSWTVTIEQYVP